MAYRILLLFAVVAVAACSHHDKSPTPEDPTPTSPLNRIDTVTAHHGTVMPAAR